MPRHVIYPGTFDPVTHGHLDILQRALRLFPRIEMVIAENPQKKSLFTLEERERLIRRSVARFKGVRVTVCRGLLVDYVNRTDTAVLVRGLRAVSDFEYEMQMALTNRKLRPNIETIFLMPNEKFIFLSSSLVRDIVRFKGNVDQFVPTVVARALKAKYRQG
ncbi:MAG: pantetheine-phosphate adenylyltransferase [Fibrobacterota bacterium]